MSTRTLFTERFGMLMACASPGSAWAYHLGTSVSKPDVVQRSRPIATDETDASSANSGTGWLRRAFDRLEQWSWDRQVRVNEAYLSQATDLCDLEYRIRQLDNDDGLSRTRALR